METVQIPKPALAQLLADLELVLDDFELALDTTVQQRIDDIDTGRVKGKTEKDYYKFLARRGITFDQLHD